MPTHSADRAPRAQAPAGAAMLATELDTLREHMERYRATTVQVLDALEDDADLAWRPTPESFSLGQQLLHVAQCEDYYMRGLLERDWDPHLLVIGRGDGEATARVASRAALRAYFAHVRSRTNRLLDGVTEAELGDVRTDVPGAVVACPLRWWLWFVLEHELHHKGQVAVYLRLMGRVAPYYAMPLPIGERPDVAVRAQLGGI
ncbi:MAG TPA: DinB family protein [Gemmatimonadaceae bacterium]|nr:DinB family protein [Gemmatimonadaceae bacterium]